MWLGYLALRMHSRGDRTWNTPACLLNLVSEHSLGASCPGSCGVELQGEKGRQKLGQRVGNTCHSFPRVAAGKWRLHQKDTHVRNTILPIVRGYFSPNHQPLTGVWQWGAERQGAERCQPAGSSSWSPVWASPLPFLLRGLRGHIRGLQSSSSIHNEVSVNYL